MHCYIWITCIYNKREVIIRCVKVVKIVTGIIEDIEVNGVKFIRSNHNNICDNFKYKCSCGNNAKYEYENEFYCEHCLFGKFNVRSKTITYYQSKEGEELGTNKDMDEVVYKLNKSIKRL